jgi:hypothetical protein
MLAFALVCGGCGGDGNDVPGVPSAQLAMAPLQIGASDVSDGVIHHETATVAEDLGSAWTVFVSSAEVELGRPVEGFAFTSFLVERAGGTEIGDVASGALVISVHGAGTGTIVEVARKDDVVGEENVRPTVDSDPALLAALVDDLRIGELSFVLEIETALAPGVDPDLDVDLFFIINAL